MCERTAIVYGVTGHGGHAPYMRAAVETLVALPQEVSFTTGAAISCGTGTAFGALVRLDVSARDTVAIFGQGPVGLSATQLASAMGARVIAASLITNVHDGAPTTSDEVMIASAHAANAIVAVRPRFWMNVWRAIWRN